MPHIKFLSPGSGDTGLCFETLLAQLSSTFTRLPAEEVDEQIEGGLAEVVLFLGIHRSSIAQFSADGRDLTLTHHYAVPGVPPIPRLNLAPLWPWYTDQLRRGATLRFTRLPEELPDEAAAEKEYVCRHGPRSHLALPFLVGGTVIGAIGFATLGREFEWTDGVVVRLRLIGDVFANALARSSTHLREADLRDPQAVLEGRARAEAAAWVYVLGADSRSLDAGDRRVREFGSAAELLAGSLDGPGCVLIDLDRCGATGLNVQAALAARELAPPVVFLTGGTDVALSVRAMKAGAVDVLARPVDDLLLQEAVARAVQRHARSLRDGREVGDLRRRHQGLTPREREVMVLVAAGLPNKVVGARLGVCEKTVKAHRGAVMRKMRADSLPELVRMDDRLRRARPSSAASC